MRQKTFSFVSLTVFLIGISVCQFPVAADTKDDTVDGIEFFESKIRPTLVKHCYECHAGSNSEGGLRLDTRQSTRSGGERGPAIVPGRPQASLLLTAISHTDTDLRMPPKGGQLPAESIADFRKWIKMGAPDPRSNHSPGNQPTDDSSARMTKIATSHWAYQSPKATDPPDVDDNGWPRRELDRFVFAELSKYSLRPTDDAEPLVFLRRLHFDLVGLPPSIESVNRFTKMNQQKGFEIAIAQEVDRLLMSTQFGERWGRHWLDVARFGESSGGESNISFPYAWRYRDYVIDAVNDDIPYDRFLTEQIAGDLLPYENASERSRLLIATGFLAVGTKNLGENNDKKFAADLVDEQIDSVTRAVLASSVACARCHHHKFDPFTMEDYYALAGIFASTKTHFGTYPSPANNRGGDPLVLSKVGQTILHKSLSPTAFKLLKERSKKLNAERKEIESARVALFSGKKPKRSFTLREVLANRWRLGSVDGKLKTVDDQGSALPLAMGVLEATETVDLPLLARGEIGREGNIIPRGLPSAVFTKQTNASETGPAAFPAKQSGRLELAEWLTDQKHPLTSRVYVNRVWKHLFGQGLVKTVDNFGTTSGTPSHPKLLDALAIRFVNDGWSLKKLVRSIVLSRSYRQASTFRHKAFNVDPENRLLWRISKRRLQAEEIRDAMLSTSGELDLQRPDGSMVATIIGERPISLIGLNKKLPADLDGSTYRSVYLPVIRDRLPDVLELFDFAEPSFVTGNRDTTNVPVQALYLMNSSFVQQRSANFANRLQQHDTDERGMVEHAFRLCFSRVPEPDEVDRAIEYLQESDANESSIASLCQALFATAEFRNLD